MKKFNSEEDAERYVDSLDTYRENLSLEELAKEILKAKEARDIMYEWELDGTFEHECHMRDISFELATNLLESKEVLKSHEGDMIRIALDEVFYERAEDTTSQEQLDMLIASCDEGLDFDIEGWEPCALYEDYTTTELLRLVNQNIEIQKKILHACRY